jgi:Ran GTPase-activating protein (RanGAP) involved in mRNA processing and transport
MLGIDSWFVDRCGIIKGINALRNLDYSYINLSGVKLGLIELNTLKHSLQQCPHIYKVVLDGCEIDDLGCEALFDILTEVPTVLHLSLRNNKITDVGLNILCSGLHANKTLLELFLSGNTFVTYIGMIALGDVLMGNPSLCTLSFMNIPERKNCLFSQEAIANNFAMLFLFTGNKDEEELLGGITHKRQKLFTKMSNLLARNDFESIKAYLKNYAQCLEQGGYNALSTIWF